jgi:hypothetical protein
MTSLQDKYRSSTEYREILRILQRATTLQENIVWQSDALGRNIISIQHFEIDFVAREVVIYFDSQRFRLDPELPLYVKLDYKTSVFKVAHYRVGQHTLHFAFPEEVKTLELRAQERTAFATEKEKFVGLRSSNISSSQKESGTEMKVRVMDVSPQGLGLIVSEQNRSFLKNNKILWITRLQEKALPYPILAEVVYINNEVDHRLQNRRVKELKVGLKLSGLIPEDKFQTFIQ